ncbi:dicarboxylate/amino acid:cation symporter [Sulfurovum sp. zt1-1]|uniref:Dicarboxylate/amino acid:cation symporter n=1 Tax=Sulfurovum zhangzhouensis TaxID=3019067 RepID=A0ABT7QX16_9BACT|nr:dicarboxylate/amino acid:cation symporter [Sulfurovum zhangzhouensis]MDM5271376.1 dicarboxylate/amino acid:cation symporter [Sulfurovum zhangzhouensis]
MSLTQKVLWSMGLGIIAGLVINLGGFNAEGGFVNEYIVGGLLYVIGKMFITALKMLVVPLVFFSLISGVFGIGDIKKLGKVGIKSFGLYMLTTAIAIAVAIGIASLVIPMFSSPAVQTEVFIAKEAPPLSDVLINIIPSNIIEAFATGNMLQIIFFSILLGISLLMVGKKAESIAEGVEVLNEAMMKMVTIIMTTAPVAVFALLAKAVSELGLDLLAQLAVYVIVVVVTLLLHLFGTLMLILNLLTRLNPFIFLQKIRDAQVFAFSTSSSNATIPVTLRSVTKRLGVDNSVASFTVPFGATINMDGTAIMQGVATVFIAHIYGVELGILGYLTVILMSVLASIGTAGIPGVGLIMLSMVFVQVGLPVEGIGLILGVDRLLDMMRTVVNVTGDAVVSTIVAKSENELDIDLYENREAGLVEAPEIDEEIEEEFAEVVHRVEEKL